MTTVTSLPVCGLGAGISGSQLRDSEAILPMPIDYVEVYADPISDILFLTEDVPPHLGRILHSGLVSPAGGDSIPPRLLAEVRAVATAINSPWILEDLGVWRLDSQRPVGSSTWPVIFDDDLVELVSSRVEALSQYFGCPFLCELAPIEVPLGSLTPSQFFNRVTDRTDCGVVLDVSHWLRYCQLVGVDPQEAWDDFPFDHVVELHLAGGRRAAGRRWYEADRAAPLLPECVDLLEAAIERSRNLRAVTVEVHMAAPALSLESLNLIHGLPAVKALRERVEPASVRSRSRPTPNVGPTPIDEMTSSGDLQERQRVVRDLLEYPALLADFAGGRRVGKDDHLFRSVPVTVWEEASSRRLMRLMELPLITQAVLARVWNDPGAGIRRYLKDHSRTASDGNVRRVDVVSHLADLQELPAWARDCLGFDRDVLRVANRLVPLSEWRRAAGSDALIVSYRRSIVDTVKALAAGSSIPAPRATDILMEIKGEELEIRELATDAE